MNHYPASTLLVMSLATCSALLMSMAGCGGGGESSFAVASPDAGATAAHVRLEGCIDAGGNTPSVGTSVHALATDGRLIASASSDGDGVFTLAVPTRQTISIAIDVPDADALEVMTGEHNLSIGACLNDGRAG